MGSPPSGEPGARARDLHRRTVLQRRTVLAVVLAGAGVLAGAWWGADQLARRAYDSWRPELETRIGRGLGHPLQLGPYRGLRPWGLAIGPSRVLPGRADDSSLAVQGLVAQLDPLASLALWAPVLQLRVQGAELQLRRNAEGRFWVFGFQAGQRPPRLGLRIDLADPGRLRVRPTDLELELRGQLGLTLHERRADWNATAKRVGQAGSTTAAAERNRLHLRGEAHWGTGDLRLGLDLRRWDLAPFAVLLPRRPSPRPDPVRGEVSGRLELSRRHGRSACRGAVRIDGLQLQDPLLPAPLQADPLALRCRGSELRLSGSRWRMANWRGGLEGSLALERWFDLRLTARDPQRGDRLDLAVRGPWRQPRLRLVGRIPLGRGLPSSPAPLELEADLQADWRRAPSLALSRLGLRSERSELVARGPLWPRLDIRSDRLTLHPSLWRPAGGLALALLGRTQPLQGSLQAVGTLGQPRLQATWQRQGRPLMELAASGAASPTRAGPLGRIDLRLRAPTGVSLDGTSVLGASTADLLWSDDRLRLTAFRSPELDASGSLPLRWQKRRGLVAGDLALDLELRPYRLARIGPLLGVTLFGELSARGRLSGPLASLRPDLSLNVSDPGSGPLQLRERWEGRLASRGAGGGDLRLTSRAPGVPGTLQARLAPNWLPLQAELRRRRGVLAFDGTARRYRWQARQLPLEGLQLTLGQPPRPQPLGGSLSGRGLLELQPLAMQGEVAVSQPVWLGVRGRALTASGRYRGGVYQLRGRLRPLAGGSVALSADGRRGGPLRSRIEGRNLPLELFQQLAEAVPLWRGQPPEPSGRASDLGELFIDTLGGSLDGQLQALAAARRRVEQFGVAAAPAARFRPQDLRGLVDIDLGLNGPRLAALNLDLAARGHLWLKQDDRDRALQLDPFTLRLEGPLQGGRGSFSLGNLPLALLALLTPVPDSLRGGLDLEGSYRLGAAGRKVRDTAFRTRLSLRQASLNGTPLRMEEALVRLEGETLAVKASLQSEGASGSVDLNGEVPLDPSREGLKLRLSSRGDGLRFLANLVRGGLKWNKGSTDLELLMRGSLLSPEANGFLRFRDAELVLAGQEVRQLNATVLFDFQELLVQEFSARMGEKGELTASGGLGLFRPTPQTKPLRMEVRQARITVPRLNALTDGKLELQGSLLSPRLTGQLKISKGTINGQPGTLARTDGEGVPQPVPVQRLVEEKWDFRQPLVLLGPEVESSTGLALRQAVPNFPYLQLSDLRLSLGPDLQVVVPPVASFSTGGNLTLNGRIDPSLRASGVVRLRGGRLSLFTTTFTLDPDAPNVAVFTPSLGLVPYVDIALRTRVSDSLNVGQDRGPINDLDLRGGYTPLDQLNLIKVVVTVSGPADRIAESIQIRSTPPLPQDRLVALIGGNSLAGLSGGSATAALATVVGQSLLSPLVSTLSNAFGQRVSFALYPTFFAPAQSQTPQNLSRRIPAQLVLGSELGLDITERFNFSVLAAPNRSDIPPQLTLRYQASDTLGLQGSFDTEGRWQTQLQLFFRF